jgi:16S rRNA (guanine527-N7)-methyltransferase
VVHAEGVTQAALRAQLDQGLQAMQPDLPEQSRVKLLDYVALLEKWNKVYNLTAVRAAERMVGVHILDSLSVIPHLQATGNLLDVGTGGGLPGIPIAIVRPQLKVTMLDSLQKKTTFIRQCISELKLENASVVCERVEQYAPAEMFDMIISRAFAELVDFVNGAGHLLRPGGRLYAMKGVYPNDEILRLPAAYSVVDIVELIVPQIEGQRHLVVIEKK